MWFRLSFKYLAYDSLKCEEIVHIMDYTVKRENFFDAYLLAEDISKLLNVTLVGIINININN